MYVFHCVRLNRFVLVYHRSQQIWVSSYSGMTCTVKVDQGRRKRSATSCKGSLSIIMRVQPFPFFLYFNTPAKFGRIGGRYWGRRSHFGCLVYMISYACWVIWSNLCTFKVLTYLRKLPFQDPGVYDIIYMLSHLINLYAYTKVLTYLRKLRQVALGYSFHLV